MRGNRDSSEIEDASLPPRLPSEASANVSQAGLRTHRLKPTCQTSRALKLSVNLAFVPVHRCGAVPDFHRYSLFTLNGRDPRTRPPYLVFDEIATRTACEYLAHARCARERYQSRWESVFSPLEAMMPCSRCRSKADRTRRPNFCIPIRQTYLGETAYSV